MKRFGPFPIQYRLRATTDGELPKISSGYVYVDVDEIALADMLGPSALRNKSGVAREARGRIMVRRVK